jgi:hypothetical protein
LRSCKLLLRALGTTVVAGSTTVGTTVTCSVYAYRYHLCYTACAPGLHFYTSFQYSPYQRQLHHSL